MENLDPQSVTFVISCLVSAVLLAVFLSEAKTDRIPNGLVGLIVLLFAMKAFLAPESVSIVMRLGFALAALATGYALFIVGAFGGGAAKLVAAVVLFLPLDALSVLAIIMVAALILSMVLFGTVRAVFGSDESDWAVLRSRVVPMSFPIGITTVCALFFV